ncbi:MAG: sirohydrochlorin cobaltochelatase [Sarcina sp.]
MNGEKKDSWKSILSESGIKTVVNLKSLGEYNEVREIYLKRIELSILNINDK